MAMFLKLEASSVANTKIQSTPGIPDFMDWNQLTALPFFWKPFQSFGFTLAAVILVPCVMAFVLSYAMFKRRVGGVLLRHHHAGSVGCDDDPDHWPARLHWCVNGITDLRTLLGWDIRPDHSKVILYFVCCFLLLGCILLGRFVLTSKLGRILVAIRDKEDRVRFSGYDVANFRCSFSAWQPRLRPSAAPCSRCRSASCRRPSSASCRRSKWSSSARWADGNRWSAPSPARF